MEAAIERDELASAGLIAGQFDGRLHRFGTRVSEVDPLGHVAGRRAASFSANSTMFS